MQSDQILISVIIPIYNQELYLEDAIQSVLSQDHGFVELILVNDGSTDKSSEICYKYIEQYDHIRYYEQTNRGVSAARNKGLSEVNGSYVFFLDGDDRIDRKFLKEALRIAEKNKSDFVAIGEDYCFRSKHIMALPTCALFLKMDFLRSHPDIRFPNGIQPCEDGLFSHQLLALTNQVALYPEGMYYYRQHDDQNHIIINKNTTKVLAQIPEWLEILKGFYLKNSLYKSHALHLALFIEHEPFELRYIRMPFEDPQKSFLFSLIKTFMQQHVMPFLCDNELTELSIPFRFFLTADDHKHFDEFYVNYQYKKTKKFKMQLLFIKLIPISKWRREFRKKVHKNYYKL
jgi:glycosyltransferase involved in cell wall biosynthesis